MGVMIELRDVTYHYPLTDKPAIKGMNFSFEEGKLYGVIGENGSGKTTFCNLIRGFAPSFYKGKLEGEILINGKATTEYIEGDLALKVGYVFQNPFNQISGVKETVFEEVAFGLENFGIPVNEIERRVIDVMKLTNISHLAEKNPFDLSGGQQQRSALASIIVLEPDILVIDEPTSQLDPKGTESVFEIISAMKEAKKTIILVEHKVDLIAEYADEVIALREGEIIKSGPTDDVLSDLTLLERGVQLPQMALLSNELIKRGIPLDKLPITTEQAIKVMSKILNQEVL